MLKQVNHVGKNMGETMGIAFVADGLSKGKMMVYRPPILDKNRIRGRQAGYDY